MADHGTNYPIAAVRLVVPDASGRVLVVQRAATNHAAGRWCLPGGKVDYGETVVDAVRHELLEEVGLTCATPRFLFYQDSLPPEPGGMHCINLYFECVSVGVPVPTEESSALAWIGPHQLDEYALAFRNGEGLRTYWNSSPGMSRPSPGGR